jgi:hypothetical protein
MVAEAVSDDPSVCLESMTGEASTLIQYPIDRYPGLRIQSMHIYLNHHLGLAYRYYQILERRASYPFSVCVTTVSKEKCSPYIHVQPLLSGTRPYSRRIAVI